VGSLSPGVSPGVRNKGQGILGSGPIVGGDTDFRNQGGTCCISSYVSEIVCQ
jgi:hypothetical protein